MNGYIRKRLNSVYELDKEIQHILAKADAMRKSLYGREIRYNGTSGQAPDDAIGKAIAQVVDYENKANAMIDELVTKRIEIENTIKSIPDPIYREVLEKRYLLLKPWDGYYDKSMGKYVKGIYEEMGCSRRQVFRYHRDAIKFLENLALNVIECH